MCELKLRFEIKFCILSFSVLLANIRKVFQNRSLINNLSLSKISTSILPGVEISRILNLCFFKKIKMDFGLKKFIWCGGLTDFDLSHNVKISTPVLESELMLASRLCSLIFLHF